MRSFRILKSVKSWREYREAVKSLGSVERGRCFEELTKHYLEIDPKYASHLKTVWLLSEVPKTVRSRLKLPKSDEGIDLIAETVDGEYWAIQCKYFSSEEKSVTRENISTFLDLTFNVCQGIAMGLVCTNGDRMKKSELYSGVNLQFVTGGIWRRLNDEFFLRMHRGIENERLRPKAFKPWIHQQEAISSAYDHFYVNRESRGKLIHPCGSGKSLTSYWIAKKLKAKLVIVVVPSLALIRQSLDVWAREAAADGRSIRWMCVCSDLSVTDVQDDDAALSLLELGVDVHTDHNEIAAWLIKKHDALRVVFVTYQSSKALSDAVHASDTYIDLAVFDEAHRTAGNKDRLFSHLLYDANIPIHRRIFMTATERRYRGDKDEIITMDDVQLFGETFDLLTFKSAIDASPPVLCDYQIVTIGVTRKEIAGLIEQNLFVKPTEGAWNRDIESQMLAAALALRKLMKRVPVKHTISFHRSIARAQSFKETQDKLNQECYQHDEIDAYHVNGRMTVSERETKLSRFISSNTSLITNAQCLTEGVDLPGVDCVLFADPRHSQVAVVQAAGRALRIAPGKKRGYILIPILLEQEISSGDLDLRTAAFSDLLTILRSMGANDERIVEYFSADNSGKQHSNLDGLVKFVLPEGCSVDTNKFYESLILKFSPRLSGLAWQEFNDAREFVHRLQFKKWDDWRAYCSRELKGYGPKPDDIPSKPVLVYRDKGWISRADWLGLKHVTAPCRPATGWRLFREARIFARSLGLKSSAEWRVYCRGEISNLPPKPDDIPVMPNIGYKSSGFVSYVDWLQKIPEKNLSYKNKFLPYEEAKSFSRNLKFKSSTQWISYCKGEFKDKPVRPEDIPRDPKKIYLHDGFTWPDWLGKSYSSYAQQSPYGGKARMPFEEARNFVHTLQLTSIIKWQRYCRGEFVDMPAKPKNIPLHADRSYKSAGWISWDDWLGPSYLGNLVNQKKVRRPFGEAREFARGLILDTKNEWFEYCRGNLPVPGEPPKPDDIPAKPHEVYKEKGWISWPDWLGN